MRTPESVKTQERKIRKRFMYFFFSLDSIDAFLSRGNVFVMNI